MKKDEQTPLPHKQTIYFLKVKSPTGQWRTIKSESQQEHEAQKQGYLSFNWEIREEYTKDVPIFYQLKLEL